MGTFTATARQIGETLQNEVDVNGRHVIVTDEPAGLGGDDSGPAPHELLPAAVAACASTMIGLYAQRHGWHLSGVEVDAVYDYEAIPRTLALTVHLPSGLTSDQTARLRKVASTCPVVRALDVGFRVEERFEVRMASAA